MLRIPIQKTRLIHSNSQMSSMSCQTSQLCWVQGALYSKPHSGQIPVKCTMAQWNDNGRTAGVIKSVWRVDPIYWLLATELSFCSHKRLRQKKFEAAPGLHPDPDRCCITLLFGKISSCYVTTRSSWYSFNSVLPDPQQCSAILARASVAEPKKIHRIFIVSQIIIVISTCF